MQDWIGKKRRGSTITEDEVTSCVFGPLRFMNSQEAWKSCLVLFGIDGEKILSNVEPNRVDIKFWPKFKRDDGQGRYVEPDIHIVAWSNGNLICTILVEVKWGSTLGDEQLLDQWRFISFNDHTHDQLRVCSRHVYLSDRPLRDAKSIESQRRSARREGIDWDDRLVMRSWHDVAVQLEGEINSPHPVEIWQKDLLNFLSINGVVSFNGFRICQVIPLDPVEWCVSIVLSA